MARCESGSGRVARGALVAVVLAAVAARTATAQGLPPVIMTEFDPRRDGLPFVNAGDWAAPAGNCWGMSLLAIDAYRRRLAHEGEREGERRTERRIQPAGRASPDEQAAVSLTQEALRRFDLTAGANEGGRRVAASDPGPIREALARIARTGLPEVLTIEGAAPGSGAHAMVLHGWRDGRLHVYDPNFPGETIEWPFDPAAGLGEHPRAAVHPVYRVGRVATTAFDAHATAVAVDALRQACASQEEVCMARFPRLAVGLQREGRGTVVTGTVAAGEDGRRPDRVWVVVNGRPIDTVPVSRFGTYRAAVADAALRRVGDNRVQVVATAAERFAGFGRVDLPAPPAPQPQPRAGRGQRPAGRGLAGAVRR